MNYSQEAHWRRECKTKVLDSADEVTVSGCSTTVSVFMDPSQTGAGDAEKLAISGNAKEQDYGDEWSRVSSIVKCRRTLVTSSVAATYVWRLGISQLLTIF